ncbi:MAG TPA: hypothetical protein VFE23_15305 [Usitatibacter sp.]|jgi:hypothetical protein|nr:hypothetical protein [Usitatibacter sp.]
MNVKVFVLRRQGLVFRDRDREGIDGALRMHSIVHAGRLHRVAQLCRRALNGSREEEMLPPLHQPELVSLDEGAIVLRGFEVCDGAGYVQEWRCEVARKQPRSGAAATRSPGLPP